MNSPSASLENKLRLHAWLRELAGRGAESTLRLLEDGCAPHASWRISYPINELNGIEAIDARLWRPLKYAMPDLERRDLIFVAGTYQHRDYVAAMGHYCGTFAHNWLGIPATGRAAFLRFGEIYQVAAGLIVEATCIWDFLELMRQVGVWPLGPSLGVEEMWPGPISANGIVLSETDPAESARSIEQTLTMHRTLAEYNDDRGEGRDGLLLMSQKYHWHPKMMWYGPAGIGTTRGLQGFVDDHQLPFRRAFPNRKGGSQWDEIAAEKAKHGGGHFLQIGDGPYSVTGGWPSIFAMHKGGGFLGLGPTNRVITMRVMDFYLHDESLIRENWVPIDIPDVLSQMDIDVFDRMRQLIK